MTDLPTQQCSHKQRNRFGECRCPKCTEFYFDANTCEIVWRCHGCGNYDPYGASGYSFELQSGPKIVGSSVLDANHGSVAPRGRMPAVNNRRYVLSAKSPKCILPRLYYAETPSTCVCGQGCGEGLITDVRNTATLFFYDQPTFTWSGNDFRGNVNSQTKVTASGASSSIAFPVKTGSLGKFIKEGVTYEGCKFHYIETGEDEEQFTYEVGDITTECWWNTAGGAWPTIYAIAHWKLKAVIQHALINQPPGSTQVSPPSPLWIGGLSVALYLELLDHTPGYIPDSIPLGSLYPPGSPFRNVRAPGVDYWISVSNEVADQNNQTIDVDGPYAGEWPFPWCYEGTDFKEYEVNFGYLAFTSSSVGMPTSRIPGAPPAKFRWESFY